MVPLQLDLNLKPQVYEPGDGQSSGSAGTLRGKVTDPNGAAVPDVRIIFTNTITNQDVEISTDDEGNYEVADFRAAATTFSRAAMQGSRAWLLATSTFFRLEFTIGFAAGGGEREGAVEVTGRSVIILLTPPRSLTFSVASGFKSSDRATRVGCGSRHHGQRDRRSV